MPEQSLPDLQYGLDELAGHRDGYVRAEQYYEGDVPEVFASLRMRRAMQRSGVFYRFNFACTPVDAICDRLEIASIKGPDQATTELLQRIWDENELDLEAPEIHARAGSLGDAYAIVWPLTDDEQAEEDAPDLELRLQTGNEDDPAGADPQRIGIYYNSPQVCRAFYDPEFPRRIRYVIKRWQLPAKPSNDPDKPSHPPVRVDLFYSDRIERYITVRGRKGTEAADYRRYYPNDDPGAEWPVPNPWGRPPVFHFRTRRPYGKPDHKGFYGPQDAIHKLIVSHLAGVDYQSFPQRYALMAAEADTSEAAAVDEDEFATGLDTGSTTPSAGEAQSTYSSDPGSLWFMRGVTGIGQFQVSDPKVFLDPLLFYIKSGAQITKTPLHYFDVAGQVPSGESLRAAEGPFNKGVRRRQLSYGATWQDLLEFALLILGVADPKVELVWAPPQTIDDTSGWQTNKLKMDAGVPPEQVFMESGYTVDEVQAWGRPPDLDSMTKAVQILIGLGTAVTMGVIDQGTAASVVARVMGTAPPEGDVA